MATFSTYAELRFVVDASPLVDASKQLDALVAKTKSHAQATSQSTAATKAATTEADKFLARLKAQSEAAGKTRSELASLRAQQLGVAASAAPYIKALQDAEAKQTSLKQSIADLRTNIQGLGGLFGQVASGSTSLAAGATGAQGAVQGLAAAAGGIAGPLAIAAAGIGALVAVSGLAVGAAIAITMRVAESAAALDDMSNQTGIAAERIALLSELAAEGGSSFDEWNKVAEQLTSKLAKQDEEGGKVAYALKELGVATKDANGEQKTQIQLMTDVIEAAKNHKDAAEGQALAVTALGTAYYKIKTSVEEAKEKESERYDLMVKTGRLMSTDLAKASGDFMDKIDRLKGAFTGMAMSIAKTVLPYLDSFLSKIIAVAEKAADIIRRFSGNETGSEIASKFVSKAQGDYNNARSYYRDAQKLAQHDPALIEERRLDMEYAAENLRLAKRSLSKATTVEAKQKAITLGGNPKTENKVSPGSGFKAKPGKDSGSKSDPFRDAISSLQQIIQKSREELELSRELTEVEKQRIKLYQDIKDGKLKVNEAQKRELDSHLSLADLAQREAKARKEEEDGVKKFREEENRLLEQRNEIVKRYEDKHRDFMEDLQREISQRGLTSREIAYQNDLKTIQRDLEAEILALTEKNVSASEKRTLIEEANTRASKRVAARDDIEGQYKTLDNDWWGGLIAGAKEYGNAAKSSFDSMREVGSRTLGALENGFINASQTGKLSWKDMTKSILADLAAVAIKAAAIGIVKMIVGGGSSGGASQGITGVMGAAAPVWGGRASGGVLPEGRSMVVGEQGPERVTAGPGGRLNVVPNHRLNNSGATGNMTLNAPLSINVNGSADENAQKEIAAALAAHLKAIQAQMPSMVKGVIQTEQRGRGLLAK